MATESLAPLLIDEREARRLLGNVSTKTMFNLRRDANLPFIKLGTRTMYDPRDLATWIERQKTLNRGSISQKQMGVQDE